MGTGATARPALPTPVRTALWLLAYVGAVALGRIIVLEPFGTQVVTPSAGVGLLWLLTSTRRMLPVNTLLLVLSTAVVLLLTGGAGVAAFALLTPVQLLLAVWLLRRWVPGIWGTGGRVSFDRLGQFGLIFAAVALAAAVQAVIRTGLGMVFLDEEWWLFFDRMGRQAAAMASIGAFGLLLGGWIAERRDAGRSLALNPGVGDLLHLTGIAAATAGVLVVGFVLNPQIPTPFLLTLIIVWAAVRFELVVTAGVCLVAGTMTVVVTILGYGPIASIPRPEVRALLAQVLVIVLMDIGLTIATTRRQLSQSVDRLRRSEAEFRARASMQDVLLANLSDGVAVVDQRGTYLLSNEALKLIVTGSSSTDAFTGTVPPPSAYHLFHPDGRPVAGEEYPYLRALHGETVLAEPFHVRRPPPQGLQVVEISAFPLPDEPSLPSRAIVVVRDVTAAATHRDSLVAFAGTVAHDLKNPLSVIDGWAETLQEELGETETPDVAMALPMVAHIRSSVEQMRALVADLLAHAVARDQTLNCESVTVHNLVEDVVASRDLRDGSVEIVSGAALDVWADVVLLRQVLDNLIGNAMKYVAPGVIPRIVVQAEQVERGWARVSISDNGIGIPEAERERVFDRFTRLTAANYSGTGLGLAICKRIVERHGGQIEAVDNPDGVGTCFRFTVPTTAEVLAAVQR